MNVLMVLGPFPPRYAGAAIQAIYLSKELKKQGLNVEFLVDNYEHGDKTEVFEGFRLHRLGTGRDGAGLPERLRELRHLLKCAFFILRNNRFDVVFLHSTPGLTALLFPLMRLLGRPTVLELTLAGSDDPSTLKKRKLGFLFHPCLLRVDKIVAISTRLHDLSVQAGIKQERLTQIPVGVDTSRFRTLSPDERQKLKERLGCAENPFVFLAVGQVEERKGYGFMLEAWRTISARLPGAVLLIAGPKNQPDNPYFNGLLSFNKKHGLSNVHFLGMISNVSDYMKIADCLIHCALAEGLPNTLIEAGLSSVPIVCRRIEGITSDILLSPEVGVEYASDRPEEFAALALDVIRRKEKKRSEIISCALKKRFDISEVAARYKAVFEEIV